MNELILGLLANSGAFAAPELAARLRGMTIDASRFFYSGPIVEDSELDLLLTRAAESGYRFCLVQAHGHVFAESWHPEGDPAAAGLPALIASLSSRGEWALARRGENGTPASSCWLVDLAGWHAAGRPRLEDRVLADFPVDFYRGAADLRPTSAAKADALAAFLGRGCGETIAGEEDLEAPTRHYLARLRHLVRQLPRGVFLWNIESYDDIDPAPENFRGPLTNLYSVAAGFKPNRLLETHGFDATTQFVYFDYSAPGLKLRQILLEDWNGRNYPDFLRRLFRRLPPTEAHYCLWEGQTPENLDWNWVSARWQLELDRWGGASVLARHWKHYRRLLHQYVQVDLLGDRTDLLVRIEDHGSAAIWWSNAFFSLVSNWFLPATERRRIFQRFLAELAAAAPGLWLYGASSDNQAVNGVTAAEAARFFHEYSGDELRPAAPQRVPLLF